MESLHQFVDRQTGNVVTERLFGDRTVQLLYSEVREHAPRLFRALVGPHMSSLLATMLYDLPVYCPTLGAFRSCGVDFKECLDEPRHLNTARRLFERKIRYWECRPMPENPGAVVSPADSRVIVGSFSECSRVRLKGKLFAFDELFGADKTQWLHAFREADFAVFRLTPDKYHYNHVPVAGEVIDFYQVDGYYHACNPAAVVSMVSPYSKNRRVVTIVDTDVPGGTQIGLVAMIEVVALMIGDVVQCYSEVRYDEPRAVEKGLFLGRGNPKSLFRPGSSTDVLLFQKGRIDFAEDIVRNMRRSHVQSRFSMGFGQALVETDLQVRSLLGHARF